MLLRCNNFYKQLSPSYFMNCPQKSQGFIPSLDLAKIFLNAIEEEWEREDPEGMRETNEVFKKYFDSLRLKIPSQEELYRSQMIQIGNELEEFLINYGKTYCRLHEGNLEGLVVKLTENDSFNKNALEILSKKIGVPKTLTKAYELLHEEFLNYIDGNPRETAYSKVKTNGKNEIEFYDFKEAPPPINFKELFGDKD